jgi:hypothetical protein
VRSTGSEGRPTEPERQWDGGLGIRPDLGLPVFPRVEEAAGFTLARLAVLVSAGIGADRVLGLTQDRAWAVLAVVTVAALTPAARIWSALTGAGVTWLLGTGFVSNRFGELSFGSSDRAHLVVMVVAALVAAGVSRRAATVTRIRERGE